MQNIRQNLFFACVDNALGVPVAAGALYPFFGFVAQSDDREPCDDTQPVSVLANALRLRRVEL